MQHEPKHHSAPALPKRDLWLLPLLVVATLAALFAVGEGVARYFYPAEAIDACQVPDAIMGTRFKPGCTSTTKAPEGPWVTNQYNECGARSATSCAAKASGTLRIVAFGSSLTEGYLIPYEQAYPVRVGNALAGYCHRPVDVQDVASIGYNWKRQQLNFADAAKLQPDVLITSIVPFDLERDPQSYEPEAAAAASAAPAPPPPPLLNRLYVALKEQVKAAYVAQYFYFKDAKAFTDLYLHYGEKANFLRTPFSPFWLARLQAYDELLGQMAGQAHAAGVPLVLVYVPQRAQAAMISGTPSPAGVDPWAFSQAIGAMAARHGIVYVNTSDSFSQLKNAADLYYPVDGHPSGDGHAVIAEAVVARLAGLAGSPFADCDAPAVIASLTQRATP
ncbi:GDSL-type esterase/lipase family protein [Pseudomonas sp. NPDC007930]|uniref:SGNH/GDSL hydrolase family protein n=1 Tax=Pseudomonas sp. NPDC007930 TaxID=3364417 RepID=UPI0036EF84DD